MRIGERQRRSAHGALRGALCAAEVQVADSPLFEHAVNLLPPPPPPPFPFPVLIRPPLFFTSFSLPRDPLSRIQARLCSETDVRERACLCAHPESYTRFMRVRATTLVHAVKFISVEHTHTHISPLYSPLTFMFKERLASSDEYRQVHAFLLSLPLFLMESSRFVFH